MVPSSLLFAAIFASVHSFTSVVATPEPQITPAPLLNRRQASQVPILSTITYPFSQLPYQVYPFPVLRGPQFGYNQCNASTEGPNSLCQTLIFNSPDDFCLWGSPDPSGLIGNVEAKVVAYCTKPTHGARLIPPGMITGLQWTKTSAYIQAVGFINNTGIGLDPTDSGGELDPHGADLQGNPLGGFVYSNGTADSNGHDLVQVLNWNTFVGSGQFCFKACYNTLNQPDYCENRFDLVGCSYNMPSSVKEGEFTSCDGDLQDVVGVYSVNGVTSTWSMPDPLTGPPPYQPRIPASSNCKTFQSTDLFLAASTTTSATTKATGSSTAKGSGASGSGSGSGAAATGTGVNSSALTSMGVPPAFYAFGLGLMAGVALVF